LLKRSLPRLNLPAGVRTAVVRERQFENGFPFYFWGKAS